MFFSHRTRHVLGAQKVYGKIYITGIKFKLFIKSLISLIFFFFGLNFILLALSNLLLGSQLSIVNRLIFCVVIYVLYTNIVHKMSLQREKEIEERL